MERTIAGLPSPREPVVITEDETLQLDTLLNDLKRSLIDHLCAIFSNKLSSEVLSPLLMKGVTMGINSVVGSVMKGSKDEEAIMQDAQDMQLMLALSELSKGQEKPCALARYQAANLGGVEVPTKSLMKSKYKSLLSQPVHNMLPGFTLTDALKIYGSDKSIRIYVAADGKVIFQPPSWKAFCNGIKQGTYGGHFVTKGLANVLGQSYGQFSHRPKLSRPFQSEILKMRLIQSRRGSMTPNISGPNCRLRRRRIVRKSEKMCSVN
jgi:hypothetical protein